VVAIKDTFSERFEDGRTTDLRKAKATKPSVRQAMMKHSYLHLATHGFFAPPQVRSALDGGERSSADDPSGLARASGWHPGLLSGLVLAGANTLPQEGEEDGILTALEVAELDLTRCELAVLSACETGLGKVAAGEGVLGLQRAFQVAGARSVVSSLWSVDDEATRKLMVAFYEALWNESRPSSRAEALRQAQLVMLREGYKRGMVAADDAGDRQRRVPPYFWAAFVLSGDWR
jgi:CHAT domain-containing protein